MAFSPDTLALAKQRDIILTCAVLDAAVMYYTKIAIKKAIKCVLVRVRPAL